YIQSHSSHRTLTPFPTRRSSDLLGQTGVRPLDGFGHRALVMSYESQNLGAQVTQREKIATLEQLAHQVTSPDFDYPAHQGFGLMDIQITQDDTPLRRPGIAE